MTYPDAIQFLYDLQMFGAKFGLENTFKLAELAGNPQSKLRFIHVAGTNGKGSTCAILESIYRASGVRVGLFTSPHMVSFAERIQVNREPISEADVVRGVCEMKTLLADADRQDANPTFFEVVTVMALKYFAEKECDLVIWETGMGGRLDATNIVTPLASVITNVELDHQKWLGETIEQIAFEKAGIIKPGVPVVTAENKPEVLQVIGETATERRAPLKIVGAEATGAGLLTSIKFPLLGEHQKMNAALALATVEVLQETIPVAGNALRVGLETVTWPGRMQLLQRASGQKVILDGAHNLAGTEALRKTLKEEFASDSFALILGILRDKQFPEICRMLSSLSDKILLVPVGSERTASPEELKAICRATNPNAEVTSCETLAQALQQTEASPFVVITGSLYLIGEAMELMAISHGKNERGLNEWSPAKK
ncbi:MAG: bifunctional folylpolyglutamate synthase/dihydrofolate synthase [Verrucomicrobia bacterium]|nr:bifunctional folylpolyglutamate synthase/dihydrofolate synthase [Verrucomicrobiota bacterium]